MKTFYRIREINADQTHLSDHRSLRATEGAVRRYRLAGKEVRVVFVQADGSWSEVKV